MRIVPMGVYSPRTGQLVDASELNRVFSYIADSVEDVSQKRYSKVVLPLPFVQAVSAGYDNTTPLETRTYRYTPVVDTVVESAQLFAHLTTSSGVAVNVIQTSTGLVPAGAVNPVVAVGVVTDVTALQQQFSVQRWTMLAGVEYQFVLSGSVFATARFDLNVNLSIDRWQGSPPVPSPSPIMFSDANSVDADDVNDTLSGLTTAAAAFATAPGRSIVTMVRHGVNSTSSANVLRIELPRGETSRMTAKITRVQCWASMSSSAGLTVTAGVWTSGGTQMASAVVNVAGVTQAYADSGPVNVAMTSGTGVTNTPTSDYSIRIACGNTTIVNKVFVVVTYEW